MEGSDVKAAIQIKVIKQSLSWAFWTQWYPDHKDDKIARILFLKTVRVRDVKFVFVIIFGSDPTETQ